MTFYQVFDSGRFCVLNSGGKGLQAKGKRQSLIYTMMLATVRNVRCFAAVTIFARGCYRYTTFQSIVSQLHGLPGADAHVTTEWPLLLLCFSLLLKCKLFYTLEILHLRLQNITSLQDYNTIIRNVLKTYLVSYPLKVPHFLYDYFPKRT